MRKKTTILITGGTGLVGSHLSKLLHSKGYEVLHLSRKQNLKATFPAYQWNLYDGTIDKEAIEKADYIVHLAGAGVADKRWTNTRKRVILNSRIKSTALLKKSIAQYNPNLKGFISASAIGIYGDAGATLLREEAPVGEGFLAEVTQKWEVAVDAIATLNIRTVKLRIGIVLSTKGGALAKMLPSYKVGVGSYFGNGKQYYSWIHIDDLAKMFLHAIEIPVEGVYNAVAPNPVTNKTLAQQIGKAYDSPALIVPAPTFGLRLALGELADAILFSNNVSAQKVIDTGFEFTYSEVLPALKDLIERKI